MFNQIFSVFRILLFFIFSLLVFYFTAHAHSLLTMKVPNVKVGQIEFVRLVEKDFFLNVTFKVNNTNDSQINIKAIRYEMLILGRLIAEDYRDQNIILNANTISTVVLPVTLDVVRLFAVMPEALVLNQLDYLLTGAVVVEDLIIHVPFEAKGVMPLFSQRI
jgi:LEA14-like dessication related protein